MILQIALEIVPTVLFGARAVAASPFANGNKKAQSHHTSVALGYGRLRLQ